MPYISENQRNIIDEYLTFALDRLQNLSYGELNYIITKFIMNTPHYRYVDMNAIIGVLESAKQEFYRRVVAPYEDKKKEENGDVYEVR